MITIKESKGLGGRILANRTVFITGSASGIGKVTARYLAERNYNVIINYRNSKNKAKALVNELETSFQNKFFAIQGDVAIKEDCLRMYKEIEQYCGGVDVLIHNAGPYLHERKKAADYSFSEWEYIINGNLNGPFYLTNLFLPYMRKNRWGRIITFGFDRAESAPAWKYRSAFAAAKSGLLSFTKTLSVEEAPNGITANMICPGDIQDLWKEKTIEEARGVIDQQTPIGRPGTGEDIARIVAFLCDEASDFVTGAVISATGAIDVLGKIKDPL